MFYKIKTFISSIIIATILSGFANASSIDDTIICTKLTSKAERKEKIKKHLLTTISNVETGRWNAETKSRTTWPWTINSNGKSSYFQSKEEAIKAVEELQAQGISSIDIGCMQINLHYHSDAFSSLEDAFDPEKNITYAAKFIKKLYISAGKDWDKAATDYHSKNDTKAKIYGEKVAKIFNEIKSSEPKNKTSKFPTKLTENSNNRRNNNLAERARRMSKANEWREAQLEIYNREKKDKYLKI